MIRRAEAFGYDYLFLIDSDLILHPDTLLHLIGTGKDIISEIFWTQWQPNTLLQPQVWMHDEYNQWEIHPGEQLAGGDSAPLLCFFAEDAAAWNL